MALESKEQPQQPRQVHSQAPEEYLIYPRCKLSSLEMRIMGPEQIKTRAKDRDMTTEEMSETDAAIRQIARGAVEKHITHDGYLMFWYGGLSIDEAEEIRKLHWVLDVEKDGPADVVHG